MALNDITIRNAKPQLKAYKIFDGGGLYLEISPSGGRSWRYKYRFDAKENRISFGRYPEITLAEAREKHRDARKLLANGIDPSEQRKSVKVANKLNANNTFEVVARDWWALYMKGKAESHKAKVIRRFELYLFPWVGNRPIADITAPIILDAIKRVEKLNKLETAHRTLQAAGQVFRYAVQNGYAVRDVTADLKGALPPTTTKHMAAFTEPSQIAELLRAIDGFNGSLTVQCAPKL